MVKIYVSVFVPILLCIMGIFLRNLFPIFTNFDRVSLLTQKNCPNHKWLRQLFSGSA